MPASDQLAELRSRWLNRVSRELAHGEGMRLSFEVQMGSFFDLLLQALVSGDAAWLEPLLLEWVQARTLTELDSSEIGLAPMLNNLLLITCEVIQESLEPAVALELINGLLPIFLLSISYTSQQEMKQHLDHISAELENTTTELERMDSSKSDFIAVAAHELKTPLTLIEGYTAMLRDMLPREIRDYDQATIELYLKGIDAGNRRLREIVDDMIDVSMIDNNLLAIRFQPVWLNRLFDVLQRETANVARERNLTVEFRDYDGYKEMTFGDGERLLKAFRNLIMNAIKYTPDGGRITVDGRMLPGFVEITFEDTGIGIDPEDHERIFDKFGRLGNVSLHSSSKTGFKGGGPGLGLPICKGIIEGHGGTIWVESEGRDEAACPGATFHVLLPIRKEPPDDKTARLFRSESERPQNIIPTV